MVSKSEIAVPAKNLGYKIFIWFSATEEWKCLFFEANENDIDVVCCQRECFI